MSPELFRKLSAAGLSHEQMAAVLEVMEAAKAERDAEDEPRKAKARARWNRWKQNAGVDEGVWAGLRNAVIARDGAVCTYCGEDADPPHIDHIIPVSRGGSSELDNLCVACQPCNSSKCGKLVSEWSGLCQ